MLSETGTLMLLWLSEQKLISSAMKNNFNYEISRENVDLWSFILGRYVEKSCRNAKIEQIHHAAAVALMNQ